MLRSMTGFGTANFDDGIYHLTIEIKSVNNRYCDIQIKMPSNLRSLENVLYKQIKDHNFRGKIDVYIKFRYTPEENNSLLVDKPLLIAYYNTLKYIKETIDEVDPDNDITPIKLRDLIQEHGIITTDENKIDVESVKNILTNTLSEAIENFNRVKLVEGAALEEDILKRLEVIKEHLEKIKAVAPFRLEKYRSHIEGVLEDLLIDKDLAQKEQRIIQEVALMADRLDITEELIRFDSHLNQFNKVLANTSGVGRSIDFLLQEMNRETNTIASKANDSQIAHIVVAIKGELEKIREQIQNVE